MIRTGSSDVDNHIQARAWFSETAQTKISNTYVMCRIKGICASLGKMWIAIQMYDTCEGAQCCRANFNEMGMWKF